ncbi:MAG: SurA N-terminal domain-containing protein [Myxococcota bacterium]
MLQSMRKNTQSTVTLLIFGAIIIVFAFNFGPGSGSCGAGGGSDYAATVDGDVIKRQDFAQIYNRLIDQQRRYGFGATDSDAQLEATRRQAIDSLIQNKLLAHEAKRHDLTTSDKELREFLTKILTRLPTMRTIATG